MTLWTILVCAWSTVRDMVTELFDIVIELRDMAIELFDIVIELRDMVTELFDIVIELRDMVTELCDITIETLGGSGELTVGRNSAPCCT